MSPVEVIFRQSGSREDSFKTTLSASGGSTDVIIEGINLGHTLSPSDHSLSSGQWVIFRPQGLSPMQLELSKPGQEHVFGLAINNVDFEIVIRRT